MGLSLTNIIGNLIKDTIKEIGSGVKITTLLPRLLARAMQLIDSGTEFAHLDTKAKIDDALEAFDMQTGLDEGSFDLIRNLPADKEEALLDHFKEFLRTALYWKFKVEGYWIPDAQPDTASDK